MNSSKENYTVDSTFLIPFSESNGVLETRVFLEGEESDQLKNDVINFLDLLRIGINRAPGAPDTNRLIKYFRAWKFWLMREYEYSYIEDILFEKEAHRKQESEFVPNISTAITKEISDYGERQRNLMLSLSNSEVEDSVVKTDLVKLSLDAPKTTEAMFLCKEANTLIGSGSGCLQEAERKLVRACVLLMEKDSLNDLEVYLLAWALHLRGNAEIIQGLPYQAEARYVQSINLKGYIDAPLIHTLRSRVNLAVAMSYSDAQSAIQLLEKVSEQIKIANSKLLDESPTQYHNLQADVLLANGNWLLASNKLEKALIYFDASYRYSVETNSKFRQLSALISKGAAGESGSIEQIINLLESASEVGVLRAYAGRVALRANIWPISHYNSEFASELLQVFEHEGVIPNMEKALLVNRL